MKSGGEKKGKYYFDFVNEKPALMLRRILSFGGSELSRGCILSNAGRPPPSPPERAADCALTTGQARALSPDPSSRAAGEVRLLTFRKEKT